MTAERDLDLLVDILVATRKGLGFLVGVDYEKFTSDEVLQNAVLRMVQILGEAASKLSIDCRESITGIPWEKIIGLRHRLVHDYFNIDIPLIWQISQEDLPILTKAIEPLVPPEDA